MKKLGLLLFPLLAITLMLGGNANASAIITGGAEGAYFVTYYSNANTTGAADETLRIVNDGDYTGCIGTGDDLCIDPSEPLYAAIYVFDNSQEFQACCSCYVSPDGVLSESVNKQLTSNELTGYAEKTNGVIKVISTSIPDPTCVDPTPGLRGTMTHVQATSVILPAGSEKSPFFVTETPLANSNLSATEGIVLEELCSFAITLGSGHGVCSCTQEDFDW
jgi:hypothetical protein